MRQRRRVTQAIRSGPLVAGRRRTDGPGSRIDVWVGQSMLTGSSPCVCVCVSFLFLECPFFSWWATPVLVPGGHKTGKKGQLVFFFFLLFIKSHYWEDYRPYKESHRRDGSVCVFHYPRDQIASSSAHNRRKILFSCFLVLFGRKDFFFFRL